MYVYPSQNLSRHMNPDKPQHLHDHSNQQYVQYDCVHHRLR